MKCGNEIDRSGLSLNLSDYLPTHLLYLLILKESWDSFSCYFGEIRRKIMSRKEQAEKYVIKLIFISIATMFENASFFFSSKHN